MGDTGAFEDLVRTIDLADMVAYAGATWDWHRLHYDPDFIQELGLPGPVVDGQVLGALMAEHVQDHLGPGWRITKLSFRLRSMVFARDTVRVTGTVTEDTGDAITLSQRVVVGERLCAEGTAVVLRRELA